MAGIYLHIPFCKQKCHYCDFHFSTNLANQDRMVKAISKELILRKDSFSSKTIETIYFGGGTPSLLSLEQLQLLLKTVFDNFEVSGNPEITLEANPDDLAIENLRAFKEAGVNRLSIGVQSFDNDVLQFMNRAHNSSEALSSIKIARELGFDNITADLIYGLPNKDLDYWKEQVQQMIDMGVNHISAYCLTIEGNTVFNHLETKGELKLPEDEESLGQFEYLVDKLSEAGFEQYEISNFAKDGFISRHNSAYWRGKHYLGAGPSAHSFDGASRSWNIRNNNTYLAEIEKGFRPFETEQLSDNDKFNDFILTRLRTKWGLDKMELSELLNNVVHPEFNKVLESIIRQDSIKETEDAYVLTSKGKFIADGIAADLFV
ncbi:MAG: oxygen-independent coproporphyrinogen-3 oxidase [Arenicella sp.]|jgi:oxygen-independent coproporphyrinogen-3 oxidase